MKAAKTDLEALEFVLPQRISEDEPVVLTQSMVFIDDISLSMDALKHLRERLPPQYHSQIAVYHSKRSKRLKRIIMEKFRSGEIKILLTTEAAGMVSIYSLPLQVSKYFSRGVISLTSSRWCSFSSRTRFQFGCSGPAERGVTSWLRLVLSFSCSRACSRR
jgi:superfamily II DNA/RNA helicase